MATDEETTNKKEESIRDERGNIKKKILDKMVDESIDKNPLLYERLSEI
jgi:hypothetical protein